MADISGISSSNNPYLGSTYKAETNDRNSLDISDYFQLLSAQLANQDMTSPMSNSEMMQQMVQMAMVQSVTSMTESMQTSQAVTTQTYAASLIGQEVTMAEVTEGVATGVKYGKVASVNFTSADPTIRLEGSNEEYPLSRLLGMGKIDDPYAAGDGETDTEDAGSADGAGDAAGPGSSGVEDVNPDSAGPSGGVKETNPDSAGPSGSEDTESEPTAPSGE